MSQKKNKNEKKNKTEEDILFEHEGGGTLEENLPQEVEPSKEENPIEEEVDISGFEIPLGMPISADEYRKMKKEADILEEE